MAFSFFIQIFLDGLIAGAIYALVAFGISLMWGTGRFVNFAHGAVISAGAYAMYILLINGFQLSGAAALSIILTVVIGIILTAFVYLPLRKRGTSNAVMLIASFAVLIIINNLILMLFGPGVKLYSIFDSAQSFSFMGALITPLEIIILVFACALLLFFIIFRRTSLGRKIQAVADEPCLAASTGVSPQRMMLIAAIIASAVGGICGIMVGFENGIKPTIGTGLVIKGFTGAVVGGISSVLGSFFGAFFVGIAENIGIAFIPSSYKNAIAYSILFLFLTFKPYGIFGKGERDGN